MRFFVKAQMDVEAANALARQGKLGSTIQSILEDLKPEAAYFVADEGMRTAYLIVNMDDPSQIPALAEPWFLAFNASFEAQPAMVAEDLAKAGPDIERAVKKYGQSPPPGHPVPSAAAASGPAPVARTPG